MSDLNKAMVVSVVLEPHPNADSLSLVRVDGYVVVVRTEDWKNEDRGAYIPPDNTVDFTRDPFKFLDEGKIGQSRARIKAKRLRGIMSQGLLVPIPKVPSFMQDPETGSTYLFKIGEDATEYFGVERYVSQTDLKLEGGEQAGGPPNPGPKYDIESWFKYKHLLPNGRFVVLTEKLHGTNARFTEQEGTMHVGSRSFYRKESDENLYWKALKQNLWIEEFCRNYPGLILYGEIFGWVQDLKYGAQQGQIWFKAFDVFNPILGDFWCWDRLNKTITKDGEYPERMVPVIAMGPMSNELVESNMSGKSSLYPGHMREGIVIKPVIEIQDLRYGRVILKAVSPEYLEKAK